MRTLIGNMCIELKRIKHKKKTHIFGITLIEYIDFNCSTYFIESRRYVLMIHFIFKKTILIVYYQKDLSICLAGMYSNKVTKRDK